MLEQGDRRADAIAPSKAAHGLPQYTCQRGDFMVTLQVHDEGSGRSLTFKSWIRRSG